MEPLLPKKQHCKSQDKLDRDEPEKDRKEKKKEKRNSKHQELFDKELKTADIPLQPSEAVILSETVSICSYRHNRAKSMHKYRLTLRIIHCHDTFPGSNLLHEASNHRQSSDV